MRSDFYGQIASLPRLRELAAGSGQYLLLPPDDTEIEQMIREPAAAAGLTFEKNENAIGLDTILRQAAASEPGALPLLEFVLEYLYRVDIERDRTVLPDPPQAQEPPAGDTQGVPTQLTFASYNALGSFGGAIGALAERACKDLSDAQIRSLHAILLTLVTGGEKAQMHTGALSLMATARLVPMSEVAPTSERADLLNRLIGARLVVASESAVRIAHEALIERWPRLQGLINIPAPPR